MMAGSTVMQQSRVLGGAQLPQQRQSAARPAARSSTVRTVAMAKRKVNTFDEAWKKVKCSRDPPARAQRLQPARCRVWMQEAGGNCTRVMLQSYNAPARCSTMRVCDATDVYR